MWQNRVDKEGAIWRGLTRLPRAERRRERHRMDKVVVQHIRLCLRLELPWSELPRKAPISRAGQTRSRRVN